MLELPHARLTIESREAAGVFANLRQRHILLALIGQEHALSDLARLSDTPLNLLHRHVSKLIRLGLAYVSRCQARAGRPIRFYRATALAFFVPAELSGSILPNPMATQMREVLERSVAATVAGVLYSHDRSGPRMEAIRTPGHLPMTSELWLHLHLTAAEAHELSQAFKALLSQYDFPPRGDRKPHLVHTALART